MLQEFDISITAVGNDRYLVRTEQVAPGVPLAQEQFTWPIEDWLRESAILMHDPLLGLLKGESSQRWATKPTYRSGRNDGTDPDGQAPTLVGLGQALYNAIFDKALRDSWLTAQGVAQHRRSPLRLRLGLKGEKLQQLPWEVLHAGDRPLGTGTDVTFSRYHLDRRQGYDRPVATVPDFEKPLRVLMVIAAPNDQDRLQLAHEAERLQNELHPTPMRSGGSYDLLPKQQLEVQLTVLEQPGRAELTQALEQGRYQVLHYAGHSNLGNSGGDLYLVSRQTGLTERISGEDLAGLLSNNGVQLAVLNSCRGAYAQTDQSEVGWHEQNLAHALVNRGIPGVIAMAERIPDDVAITFTQLLYRNLKQGNPIDLCLNRTRQGLISAHGSHHSYWALPILYMQPGFDGYLASKPGNHNSALDQLLSESESALAALDQTPSLAATQRSAQGDGVGRGDVDPVDLDKIDLDNVVETVELEEILSYNEEDASTMTELVEQLSKPSVPDEVMLADVDESLIPEPLETPGLDLYDQLPKKPVEPPASETPDGANGETSNGDPSISTTIYSEDAPHPSDVGDASGRGAAVAPRQRRQVVMGVVGAAALVALAGVGISDPLNVFSPSSPSGNDSELSTDVLEASSLASGDPETIAQVLSEMAAAGDQSKAITWIDQQGGTDQPALLFSKGQLQWDVMNQASSVDGTIGPAEAMRSWQNTLDVKPNWLDAQVALGFAYYEQERYQEAIEIWLDALDTGKVYAIPTLTLHQESQNSDIQADLAPLHAHVGLVMAYYRQSEQGATESDKLPLVALAVDQWKDLVQTTGGQDVTAGDLSSHWLWSERALADWSEVSPKIAREVSQAN